jgi:hypothetical protein
MLRFDKLNDAIVSEVSLIKKEFIQNGVALTFHPTWITHLKRFKVLRFMNWMSYWKRIPKMDWADRPTKNRWTQASCVIDDIRGYGSVADADLTKGVAPEYIIELAKEVGCDVWLNIPPTVTKDYIEGLATMMKRDLTSTTKIYLEYGNEVWTEG